MQHLEDSLKLWDAVTPADRPDAVDELTLLRRASWAAGTSGEPERAVAYARSAVALADRSGDPATQAWVRRRLAQLLGTLDGREHEALEIIEQAWELVRDAEPSSGRAWVLAVYARSLRGVGRVDDARARAELAVAQAREVRWPGAEADALTTLAVLDEARGRAAEAQASLTEAIARARESSAFTVELRSRYSLAVNQYEQGKLGPAREVADEGVDRACTTGLMWSDYGLELRVVQVIIRYTSGDWDGSEVAAEPPGRRVSGMLSARLAAVGAHVAVGRGRFVEVDRLVRQLRLEWHRDLQIPLVTSVVAAELAGWRGRPEQAIQWISEALEFARKAGGQWVLAGIRMAALGIGAHADIVGRANRRDTAEVTASIAAAEELVELARQTADRGSPRTGALGIEGRAWLARAEAELSRLHGENDPALWRRVVTGFGYGAVYEQAISRWKLADALLGADRRDEAADELRAAAEVAGELGAKPLHDAVRALARRARISLDGHAVVRDTTDLLTPRELSVLQHVALGRTNKQVGEELYISEKTVSVHLSRVMAKLGAGRRAEAVAIAYDRGLLERA